MTGSHEVRGSIPLGSTNIPHNERATLKWPFVFCSTSAAGLMRSCLAFKRPNQAGKTEHYRYYRDNEAEGWAAPRAAYSTGSNH